MVKSQRKRDRIDKETFKDIFRDYWEAFKKSHPGYDTEQYNEPVRKMLECGDASGGYNEYRCRNHRDDGKKVAFSCKSGFCLSCARKYTDDFVSRISRVMHPDVHYRHIVQTERTLVMASCQKMGRN